MLSLFGTEYGGVKCYMGGYGFGDFFFWVFYKADASGEKKSGGCEGWGDTYNKKKQTQ